jgi:dipeptidyl aminopeptidase/acylaminoacyl peptidase
MLSSQRRILRRRILPATTLMALLLPLSGHIQAQERSEGPFELGGRYFTVRDSIEMARFERTGDEAEFSPDGKYVAVVTSRGNLQSNTIESTLRVFQSEEVRKLLRTEDPTKRCNPKIVARLVAVPKLKYLSSYEHLITNVRWLPNSKTVLFLGQDSQEERLLYMANVVSGSVRALTPKGYNVRKFEFAGRSIVCEVTRPDEKRSAAEFINHSARDVTRVRLTSILFPQTDSFQKDIEFWVVRNGGNRRMIDPSTQRPVHLAALPPSHSVLSLSPNVQSAVVLIPSESIPISWESYEAAFAYLKLHSDDPDATSESWPAQYALIDLHNGCTTKLVNAPNAWALGSADANQAVWSSDEKKLLLTNTYLPLDVADESERSDRLRPCAAAIIEVLSRANSCVVFSTYDRAKKHLVAGLFGQSDEEVVLRFWNAPNTTTEERYRYDNGTWQRTDSRRSREQQLPSHQASESVSESFSLVVRQDLNTPPALWAVDRNTGRCKRVWDPNPQLMALNLGEVSEFRWKDKSGYEWIGGLVMPPDYTPGKRYPMVIQTHGFLANEFITDGAFTTAFAARPLASAGIVVLQMRTRHDHMVSGFEAADQIAGYESAIERLVADGIIDPERVGIIGFSRTCYYVESALIKDPKRFAAATLADGVDESYMNYLLFGVGRSHDEGDQIYGGAPFGDDLKRWTARAPGFHLDRVQTPLRLEAIGPASVLQEWEIYASLSKQQKPVDLIYLPGGQHILQKPLDRLASQQGNVDWFRFWLKDEEDPDPQKEGQYRRWRQLKARGRQAKTSEILHQNDSGQNLREMRKDRNEKGAPGSSACPRFDYSSAW